MRALRHLALCFGRPAGADRPRVGRASFALSIVIACAVPILASTNAFGAERGSTVGKLIVSDPPPGLTPRDYAAAQDAKNAIENCDLKRFRDVVRQAGFRQSDRG